MRTNQHVYGERGFWVKGQEAKMIKERKLTVIIREKDRSDPVRTPEQWAPLFKRLPVYYIKRPGNQEKGVAALFEPDDGTTIQVVRRTVTRLGDITDGDLHFGGGSAVPKVAASVSEYLQKELSPGQQFSAKAVMTLYWVEYLLNEEPAANS